MFCKVLRFVFYFANLLVKSKIVLLNKNQLPGLSGSPLKVCVVCIQPLLCHTQFDCRLSWAVTKIPVIYRCTQDDQKS